MQKNKKDTSYINLYTNHIKSIFDNIGVCNKFFIEIGFNNQKNINDHTIYFKQNKWKGFWIANTNYYETNKDTININISKDNFNSFLMKNYVPNNFDLLILNSGENDFWLWNSLHFKPCLVMIPYNPFLQYNESKVLPYNSNSTNINTECYGSSSFNSLIKLGNNKNYTLLNSHNYYLFFITNYLYESYYKKQRNYKKYFNKPIKDLKNIYEKNEYLKY